MREVVDSNFPVRVVCGNDHKAVIKGWEWNVGSRKCERELGGLYYPERIQTTTICGEAFRLDHDDQKPTLDAIQKILDNTECCDMSRHDVYACPIRLAFEGYLKAIRGGV